MNRSPLAHVIGTEPEVADGPTYTPPADCTNRPIVVEDNNCPLETYCAVPTSDMYPFAFRSLIGEVNAWSDETCTGREKTG